MVVSILLMTYLLLSILLPGPDLPPHASLLMVSYPQVGSSVLAKLFQSNPEILFWEDPLDPLSSAWRKRQQNELLRNQYDRDRALLVDRTPPQEERLIQPLMKAIFSCDVATIEQMNPDILKWSVGNQLQAVMTFRERFAYNILSPAGLHMALLQRKCMEFRVHVVHTTRLPMLHLQPITASLPEVRVIHVTRDPRGIIGAWVKLNLFDDILGEQVLKKFCDGISSDLKLFNRLSSAHQHTMYSVRIEDLKNNKQQFVKMLYEFLNLEDHSLQKQPNDGFEINWDLKREEKVQLQKDLNPNDLADKEIDFDWKSVLSTNMAALMGSECKHALVKLKHEAF